MTMTASSILPGIADGPILSSDEPLSFWGGVDPATGRVIDVHHPLQGRCIAGCVLMMPSTRGSCTGSGVLLDLVLSGRGPAALIFSEPEDVVTLGALIAAEMFGKALPVLRLSPSAFEALSGQASARIGLDRITAGNLSIAVQAPGTASLDLTGQDRAILDGGNGTAAAQAMRIICAMAAQQGARRLVDVTQAHIDGCIYASPANLTFAERMAEMGARVTVPTTMNAISVDRENWRRQGVPPSLGNPAQRLADAYVRMGCRPTFTCSPYLLDSAPGRGEAIAWAESNAVVYANSILGARTAKHPDFLDLCIAITGRAPLSGVYLDKNRTARRIIDVDLPAGADDAFWPLLGYLAGRLSPDRIPLLRGLAPARPGMDELKALCAAFGTTSGAAMLHVEAVTPEAGLIAEDADHCRITRADLEDGWRLLNDGPEVVDLVALGSPHASLNECRALARGLAGGKVVIPTILTTGRDTLALARAEGVLAMLEASGVTVLPDLCWCSISEPVFPVQTHTVMTNSGKYAHYGPGLSGRAVRFGNLAQCVRAALTGRAPGTMPDWMRKPDRP
ncbi:putative aconitase subunit 1 /predicted aconitase subunit 2 [Paracoccus pantotrophus]|uniref:Aconitase subunit 1 /predicted aconitase subunit 2 n=2 Tax=Paracoccus pantotrophus TaxID=82367 RepID=A0ABX9S4Y8_PARPN|nr:aconitase X [Paracoccus pantotrophus]RKS43054.1 putative aconitase subunit 1 /predicted aconitase subunit 2 [Paracoccus pantotrophus]